MQNEPVDAQAAEPGYHAAGGFPKEIKAHDEQDGIENTGDKYPFPKPVCPDKVMRFCIGLESNNDLF